MMDIGGEDAEAITEFLSILEEHRQNCVRQGKRTDSEAPASH